MTTATPPPLRKIIRGGPYNYHAISTFPKYTPHMEDSITYEYHVSMDGRYNISTGGQCHVSIDGYIIPWRDRGSSVS